MPDGFDFQTRPTGFFMLPQNVDAESCYLGCALHGMRPELIDTLQPDDFAEVEHRALFAAMKKVRDTGGSPDLATVSQCVGPAARDYLLSLADSVTSTANEPLYAEAIRDNGRRRREIALAGRIADAAERGDDTFTLRRELADMAAARTESFPVMSWADLEAPDVWEAQDLIKGALPLEGITNLYGPSSCGKSFLALDISLHVALGWDWQERRVEQGAVVYIASEGGRGLHKRVAAFRKAHADKPDISGQVPFVLIPTAVNLLDPAADTEPLIAEVRSIGDRLGQPVRLVVIDTLSRSMPGGDENGSDMTAFVNNVDRIRSAFHCQTLIVHHTGKDATKGARGFYSLTCNVDTEIVVSRDNGVSLAKFKKQRDGETDTTFAFTLGKVSVGFDREGDAVTSCVVEPAEAVADQPKARGAAKVALEALHRTLIDSGQTAPTSPDIPGQTRVVRMSGWQRTAEALQISNSDKPDSKRRAFVRAAQNLQALGIIGKWQDWVWLADKPDRHGQNQTCPAPDTDGRTDRHGHTPLGVSGVRPVCPGRPVQASEAVPQ